MEACLEDMKSLLRKRLGLPQQSLATQTHTPTRVSRADLAQSPLHGVAEHMFVTAIEIGEASTTETTQSHKLLAEGSDFAAVTDSVSVVADHPEETTPAVSTDPTPSLFLLNPPTPNTLTETVGSSMEKKFEVNHELTAPPQPNPPNASIPDFTKHENPLRLQMNFTLISKVCMSWYWVRSVREANAELEWEKLKRTLLDGLFFPTLGCKCVGSGDTNKKTQIQICWVWQKEYKILMQHFPHHSTVFLALGQNFREAIEDTTKRMGAGMAKISCKLVETVVDYDDSSGSVILVVIPCVNLASTTAELVVEMLQQGSSKFINHFFVIPAVLERKNVRYWRLWADYRRMIRASLVLGKSLFDAGKNDFSLNELIPTDGQGFNTSYAAIYDIFVARSLQENFLGSKYAYNFKMPSVLVQRGNDLFSLFTQDLYMLDSETTELHNLILAAIYVKSRLLNNFWVACGAGNLVFRAG